jgi:hypothetical protein
MLQLLDVVDSGKLISLLDDKLQLSNNFWKKVSRIDQLGPFPQIKRDPIGLNFKEGSF